MQRLYSYQNDTLSVIDPASPGWAELNQNRDTVTNILNAYSSAPVLAPATDSGGGMLAALLLIGMLIGGMMLAGGRTPNGAPPASADMVADAPVAEAAQPTLAALVSASQAADLIVAGQELRRAGRYAEAALLFEQAIATDPVMLDGYSALAFCLYELGRVEEAVQRWDEALLRSPQEPDALAGLGMALYAQGSLDEGIRRFREAVAIEPRYLDESFLRAERGWSEGAIIASRPLREALVP